MADFDARGLLGVSGRSDGQLGHDMRGNVGGVSAAPPPDAIAPTITNVSPAAGTPISKTQVLSLDVTDETSLFVTFLIARFEDGTWEVVHDGVQYAPLYLALSSRTAITGGFRYMVGRVGGWPSAPTFRIRAFDDAGNEAA